MSMYGLGIDTSGGRSYFGSDWRSALSLVLAVIGATTISTTAFADEQSPIQQKWQESPHADSASESFRHWDKDGEIPTSCATCHSMTGFLDFTGEDGSQAGVVDNPAAIGTVVGCSTCHHEALEKLDSVAFPSGFSATDTGSSTTCLVCHQGRLSTVQVDEKLEGLDDDTVSDDLAFLNVHYRAAGASLYGGDAKGGYEYAGKQYVGKFAHPAPFDSCSGCHDPHTLAVQEASCATCHAGVENLADIRLGSGDIDGNGDQNSGVSLELSNMHKILGETVTQYAAQIAKAPIAYHPHNYPYFFEDTNNDGKASDDEAIYPNRYQHWTPRLVRAAYNYQFYAKDPGIWAHNPRYAAQLLIDSVDDLAGRLKVSMPDFVRP